MKKQMVVILILIGVLGAQYNHASFLIDSPTAYVLRNGVFQGGMNGSVALTPPYENYTFDADLSLFLGIGNRVEMSLGIYTPPPLIPQELPIAAFDINLLLMRELIRTSIPSIAVGIENISYSKYISSLGSLGFSDDTVTLGRTGVRPADFFSVYGVISKTLNQYLSFHIGLGTGRFVGYEPAVKFFNTGFLHPDVGVEWGDIGLFFGMEVRPYPFLSIIFEMDGRDYNSAVKLAFEHLDWYVGFSKMEQFFYPQNQRPGSPRLNIGFTAYTRIFSGVVKGTLIGKVVDRMTYRPLQAEVTIFTRKGEVKVITDASTGFFKIELPEGEYNIIIKAPGYREEKIRVKVTGSQSTVIQIPLVSFSTSSIRGRVYDEGTNLPLHASIYVEDMNFKINTDPSTGEFVIHGLPIGYHIFMFEAKGYFPRTLKIEVKKDTPSVIQVPLSRSKIVYYFDRYRSEIDPKYKAILDEIVTLMKRRRTMIVEIRGYTDSVGDWKKNIELSRQRAQAVKDYLVKNGISPSRLIVKGFGENNPIGDNRTIKGRDLNRRVEIYIVEEK